MGSKGGVTAPQARYLAILVKKCQNLFAFLPFPIYQASFLPFLPFPIYPRRHLARHSFGLFFGGGANDSLGTCH